MVELVLYHILGSVGILLVLFGIMMSMANNFYIFCLGLAMIGVGVVIFNINSTHIRCTATPKHMRTSFEFVFLACCIIFIPVGVLLTTWALNNGFLVYFYGVVCFVLWSLSLIVYKNSDIAYIYQISNDRLDGFYVDLYPNIYK